MTKHPVAAICATVLNVFLMGTGHVVLGQTLRFLKVFAGFLLMLAFAGVTGIAAAVPGFVALAIGTIAMILFVLVDGWLQGLRHGFPDRKWYVSVAYLLLWFAGALAFMVAWQLFREPILGHAAIRITDDSVSRFLQPGDVILVDTRSSRHSQLGQDELVVATYGSGPGLYVGHIMGKQRDGTYLIRTSTGRPLDNTEPIVLVPKDAIFGTISGIIWPLKRVQNGMRAAATSKVFDR